MLFVQKRPCKLSPAGDLAGWATRHDGFSGGEVLVAASLCWKSSVRLTGV